MTDDRFEELMRDAADSYNPPPDVLPLDEMWWTIERSLSGGSSTDTQEGGAHSRFSERRRVRWYSWLRAAALLVLGIGLGRASAALWSPSDGASTALSNEAAYNQSSRPASAQPLLTDQYLGQTVALLIALPTELSASRPDSVFARRVDDLLLQTRLLIDAPGLTDPELHTLLEDLEFVLAQITRLQADRDPMKIDLFNEALEQRELMPRLREAAIHHMSD